MKKKKITALAGIMLFILGTAAACGSTQSAPQPEAPTAQSTEQAQSDLPAVKRLGISHEEEFGGAYRNEIRSRALSGALHGGQGQDGLCMYAA